MPPVGQPKDYLPDSVEKILELLRNTFGKQFNYFNGDPIAIAESSLPAITVSEPTAQIQEDATGTDEIIETVLIKLVFNKKDDLGASPDTLQTEWKQRHLVKGQDPQSKEWADGTLMKALRENFTIDDTRLSQDIRIEADVNVRPEDVITNEYWVTITTRRLAFVPSRT